MENRKRLRPWLWRHTDAGDYGLRWVDKDEGIFRIPWVHRSSRVWNSDYCQVFKEWAKFTNKYREGDAEDFPGWKTRLRTSLTKLSKDFEEIPELHKMDDLVTPYKVYRFKNIDGQRNAGDHSVASPSCSQSSSSDCTGGSPGYSSSSPSPYSNFQQSPNPPLLGGNIPNILESYAGENASQSSNEFATAQCYDDQQQPFVDCLDRQASFSEFTTEVEMPSVPNSRSLSSDLRDLDSETLAVGEKLPSNELNQYKSGPNSKQDETNKPTIHYQLYYLDEVVKEGDLYSSKYHFHFGPIPAVAVSDIVYGPTDVERIELPDVTNMKRSINSDQQRLMQKILLQMDRGFLLKCNNEGDIYAQRLCRTRMYVTNPTTDSLILDRQTKTAQMIFDLKNFRENCLGQENKRPPFAILSFAQELKLDSFKTLLMHIKLTSLEAQQSLAQSSSTNHSSNLQFSDLNSGDLEIRHQMDALSLGNTK